MLICAAFKNSVRVSPYYYKTYFVWADTSAKYSFPVISIITDSSGFFGSEKGIYVAGVSYHPDSGYFNSGNYFNRGSNWERPVFIEFYNEEGKLLLSQNCGVRIHGNSSRAYPVKALRLYADTVYDKNYFYYDFFKEGVNKKFKRLLLRPSSQDFERTMFADLFMTELAQKSNLDYQKGKPCILFLNGEYWGIHNLRERIDEYFLEDRHAEPVDSIDIIEYEMKALADEGSIDEYGSLIDFLNNNDMSQESNYTQLKSMIDIENFMDYYIFKIFFSIKSWPAINVKMWRPKSISGKWRMILFDNDEGFRDYGFNSMLHAASPVNTNLYNPPWSTLIFRQLLENNAFRSAFVKRFDYHLQHTFNRDLLRKRINYYENIFNEEIDEHIERWGYPENKLQWQENVSNFSSFAQFRSCYMQSFLQEYFPSQTLDFNCNPLEGTGGFMVFPNPAADVLHLYYDSDISTHLHIEIFNLNGDICYTNETTIESYVYINQLDISDFVPGVYIVRVLVDDELYIKKFIKI